MANPQIEDGYTKIANELLSALTAVEITGAEFMICLAVIGKTYGWNKKEDKISLTQFQRLTKMSRPRIVRAISNLVRYGVLGCTVGDAKTSSTYWIIKDYNKWIPSKAHVPSNAFVTSKARVTEPSYASEQKVVTPALHTQYNNKRQLNKGVCKQKETLKSKHLQNPEFVEIFGKFIESRNKLKKPLTIFGQNLILKKLEHEETGVVIKMIEQSIENSWQGIFPLKQLVNTQSKLLEGF